MTEPAKQQSAPPEPAPAQPDDAATYAFPLPLAWPATPHGTFNGLDLPGIPTGPGQAQGDERRSPRPGPVDVARPRGAR